MNCKPGDLAVVVKSVAGNEGKILRVICFVGEVSNLVGNDRWITDTILNTGWGYGTNTAQDSQLRPIRPGESPEESAEAMRRLTQLPSEVTA